MNGRGEGAERRTGAHRGKTIEDGACRCQRIPQDVSWQLSDCRPLHVAAMQRHHGLPPVPSYHPHLKDAHGLLCSVTIAAGLRTTIPSCGVILLFTLLYSIPPDSYPITMAVATFSFHRFTSSLTGKIL